MVSVSRLSAAHHYGVLRPFPPKVSLLAHQISELKNAGVREDRIFTDIMTGATDEREGLQRLLARAEKDDVIICTKMDRLGRNTADMIRVVDSCYKKGIAIRFLENGSQYRRDNGQNGYPNPCCCS